MDHSFHSLTVGNVEPITSQAVAISFNVPDELSETFQFLPGQYLTLRANVDGEDIRRSYSICSKPGEPLTVGIKQVEQGRFSTFAQGLKAGDTLEVMPPQGNFICQVDENAKAAKSQNLILIAAGSGITPMLSIASAVLECDPSSRVTLVYGNQATQTIMFREALEDLKDRFLDRFEVFHVLSREAQDVELFHGRIDVVRIKELAASEILRVSEATGIYLCGPAEMTLALEQHFIETGVPKNQVHTELFEAPGQSEPVVISKETVEAAKQGVGIEVTLDGLRRRFTLADASQTVLEAAEGAGLELPFSCAGGMCATCRCKVTEGDAEMDRNFSLDDWELEAGFVLACQLRPKSSVLKLDFDAA